MGLIFLPRVGSDEFEVFRAKYQKELIDIFGDKTTQLSCVERSSISRDQTWYTYHEWQVVDFVVAQSRPTPESRLAWGFAANWTFTLSSDNVVHSSGVWLDPLSRGKGIGRKLLNLRMRIAYDEIKAECMTALVRANNTVQQHLLRTSGWVCSSNPGDDKYKPEIWTHYPAQKGINPDAYFSA